MSNITGDMMEKIIGNLLPQAADFIGDEQNREMISSIVKATSSLPTIDRVEYDEDNRAVYVIMKMEPALGVDIKEYADAVDEFSKKILQFIIAFFASS